MTALCSGGGSSHPKAGVADLVIFGAGALADKFIKSGNGWLEAAAPILGVISYEAISLCSSDPPDIPTMTDAEATAVLNLSLGDDFLSGLSKLRDIALNAIWFDLCECTSGTQPTPPPPLPASSSIAVPLPTTNCASYTSLRLQFIGNGNYDMFDGTFRGGTATPGHLIPIPSGASSVELTAINSIANNPSGGANTDFVFFKADRTVSTPHTGGVFQPPAKRVYTIPVDAVYFGVSVSNSITSSDSFDITAYVNFICNGAVSGTTAQPCCPPDTITTEMLRQIWDQVNLLQRYMLPFAYISGSVHSGVTGSGSFAVSRLIGMRIQITTTPPYAGLQVANPDFLYDLGWMSLETADSAIVERRIRHGDTTWLPRLMQEATTFGYFLNPGVVASFTELEAEP